MNIIFIDCPVSLVHSRLPLSWGHESLNIAYIATMIKSNNAIKLFDFTVQKYTKKEFLDFCDSFRPSIIGFSCTSASYLSMKIILEDIKYFKNKMGTLFIAGGAHPSSCPEITLNETVIDIVVKGEGEIVIKNIVEKVRRKEDFSTIKGIYYKNGSHILKTEQQEQINNLSDIPFPARELLPLERYRSYSDMKRLGNILSSRGCPFSCTYCYHSKEMIKKVRFRSPIDVYNEMKQMKEYFKVKKVIFVDDHFILNKNRVKDICRLLVKKPLGIYWECQGRVDSSSHEVYQMLKSAGCKTLTFGIESGDETILKFMKKRQTLEQIEESVFSAKKAGLKIRGNFILGSPIDTKETIINTIRFAK